MDQSNKIVIVYDLVLCPDGASIEKIVHVYKTEGFLLYDSRNENGGGRKPDVYNAGDLNFDLLVDISTQESLNILKKLQKNG